MFKLRVLSQDKARAATFPFWCSGARGCAEAEARERYTGVVRAFVSEDLDKAQA